MTVDYFDAEELPYLLVRDYSGYRLFEIVKNPLGGPDIFIIEQPTQPVEADDMDWVILKYKEWKEHGYRQP